MLPTVDLLPFVSPLADPTLNESDFTIAVQDWNDHLSRILKLNIKAFWTELFQNQSLVTFLNSFLGEYASFRGNKDDRWIQELEAVVRRVWMLYRRISETITAPEAKSVSADMFVDQTCNNPGSALLDQGLVSTSVLMDLAGIYGSADPEGVSKMVGAILQNTPTLVSDFRTSTNTVVQIIHKVQKRFEKGPSGGAGKGKGKGKGVSHASAPGPNPPELDQEELEKVVQYATALSDIAYTIDAISASSPVLATELDQHPDFMECLSNCYNYTLPVLTKLLEEKQTTGDISPRSILTFLRVKMLSIINNILDGIYQQYLDSVADISKDSETAEDESRADTLMDHFCEVVVNLYEQLPLQGHMVPMQDAPMILDLEIQFCISEKLSKINVEAFHGENDRLNHWVVVLSDLRGFNLATSNYINEHNMRKSEKLAREMSNLYSNQEHGRSNSTIISDTSAQRTNSTSEEDYVKRTMLISQLQDLFPDMGDGFLEACLITYKDDPEIVTMRLLDDNLPSDLATMDRSTVRSIRSESAPTCTALVRISRPEEPEQDPLSNRRNIFDGDEFDVFSGKVLDPNKVSRGGKKGPKEAQVVLDDKTFVAQHKSAILQAVELMNDDEYDDTYDSMGINSVGTDFKSTEEVESIADTGAKNAAGHPPAARTIDPSVEHEEALISMYMGDKDVFKRSAEARRSRKRQDLRNLTKMSDEQLEGWAIMFDRNPRKDRIVQKYEFRGEQAEIERAAPVDKRRGGRIPNTNPSADKNAPGSNTGGGGGGGGQGKKSQPQQRKPQPQKGHPPKGQPQKDHPPKDQPQKDHAQKDHPQQNKTTQPTSKPPSQSSQSTGDGSTNNNNNNSNNNNNNNNNSSRERANDERRKASKANHNRRNQHAKKMASMHP
ncbi:hypothetical protein B0O80DRAFT_495307 [Mortierella sp. GBAus27b]|nr:hypothetical protein BGX31_010011 [Mortierella sp. GBA43]KAI8358618.1 hypothetical protein B0O80DRAFT_495307 [Mortierella sp. GBAus27b]